MNATTAADSGRGSLTRLYLIRGVLAIAWALAFAQAYMGTTIQGADSLRAAAVVLLVAYPLLDAVSSVIDYRSIPERITAFNSVVSTLVAIGLGIAGPADGIRGTLAVFGAWAVVSGAAQLTVGLRRRSLELGKQWPMLIAGGLSVLVGVFYEVQAAGDAPSLSVLSVYAIGGGLFFIIQAAVLARKARRSAVKSV